MAPSKKEGPPPKRKKETPKQAFEALRQSFDVIKEKHTDPWNWHEYLMDDEEPDSDDDEDDPERTMLDPTKRPAIERLKSHLLTMVAEMGRTAQLADTAYYHICTSPDEMKDCVMVLGTAGDIDEDMLASGNASPQKLMAALQQKLEKANDEITLMTQEIASLKDQLCESRFMADQRWIRWQETKMLQSECLTRLNDTKVELNRTLESMDQLKDDYKGLYFRFLRASRMMIYKGRQQLRDKVLIQNKKENLFWAFEGMMAVIKEEKEERVRREREAERDSIEFALRNEVEFLLREKERHHGAVQMLTTQRGRLKQDRRALACRLLHKNRRPMEHLEYCLWIWELWQPLRAGLRLEKLLETERAKHAATSQQLVQTTSMAPYLANQIDDLRIQVETEKIAHDTSRRKLTLRAVEQIAANTERLRVHRNLEQAVLHRIHRVDVEGKEERIAVLEREIAEDAHVHALKGMVVDLECNLRRALDRRKVKGLIAQPGEGQKCAQCQRSMLFDGFRGMSPPPRSPLVHSASEKYPEKSGSEATPVKPLTLFGSGGKPWPTPAGAPAEKEATYTAGWR
mmetsp:Transcript_656/g.2067  ORF Transcript_656/g.2067 Transcript_656/m.2067 type:complete len:571 (-) Transcript_656:249-1961(-)